MNHHVYQNLIWVIFSVSLGITSTQAISAEPQPIATVTTVNTIFSFQVKNGFSRENTQTSITGPREYALNVRGSTNIDLSKFGELDDGLYRYEITSSTGKKIKLRKDRLNNGRGKNERNTITESESQTGNFRIKNGNIVSNNQFIEES